MASMYEIIMSLPLFCGISREHVSAFAEKTHLNFRNYKKGETISSAGDSSDEVRIIVSGKARITHTKADGELIIEEVSTRGRVLGAERLFGIHLKNPFRAEALEDTGIMSFSKDEYLALLRTETIYLVNFLNYLSARAQRTLDFVMNKKSASLIEYIAAWLTIFTEPRAESYLLRCPRKKLIALTNLTDERIDQELSSLEKLGMISREPDTIHILDRQAIIERADKEVVI